MKHLKRFKLCLIKLTTYSVSNKCTNMFSSNHITWLLGRKTYKIYKTCLLFQFQAIIYSHSDDQQLYYHLQCFSMLNLTTLTARRSEYNCHISCAKTTMAALLLKYAIRLFCKYCTKGIISLSISI